MIKSFFTLLYISLLILYIPSYLQILRIEETSNTFSGYFRAGEFYGKALGENQNYKEKQDAMKIPENQNKLDRKSIERHEAAGNTMILIIVLTFSAALSILCGLINIKNKNRLLAKQKKEIQEKNVNLEQKNNEIIAQRDEIENQRDLLIDQKEQIEHIHLNITKSIHYAKKIQNATLPDLEILNSLTKEYFILFKPRDIVSGDFYWFTKVNGTIVLTVADCTGHGVPGAFMSILGMSLLKETVLKEYITQPAVILRRLRKDIIAALGQKGNPGEQKEGMDMALISITEETHKIEYAGAYNSIYIIRDKTKTPLEGENVTFIENKNYFLFNVHADKMPIALYDRMDRFTNIELQYEEGDQIYLFTDGYADQFGGPEGKKFMYKPFMNLLLDIAGRSMERQNEILSETLNTWRGNLSQVDDITVIGVKL